MVKAAAGLAMDSDVLNGPIAPKDPKAGFEHRSENIWPTTISLVILEV